MTLTYKVPQKDKLNWGGLILPLSFGLNVILLRISFILAYVGYGGFSEGVAGLQWLGSGLLLLSPLFAVVGLVETFRLEHKAKHGFALLAALLPLLLTGLGILGYAEFPF